MGLVAIGALMVAVAFPALRPSGRGPAQGRLPPHRPEWLADPESVVVRPGPEVGLPGAVQAVVRAGDHVLWVDPTGGALFELTQATGSAPRVRAAREHLPGVRLRRPEGLAVTSKRVWVLDVATRELLGWDRELRPAGRIPLGSRAGFWATPIALDADAAGRPVVLSREVDLATGRARWTVDRLVRESGHLERVWDAPAPSLAGGLHGVFDAPAFAPRSDGGLLVAHAESYRVVALGPRGDTAWAAGRRRPPRFSLSGEERRSYRRTLDRMPGFLRRQMPLPRHWPPVAWIGELDADRWVAAIRAAEDAWHVEVVRRDGEPLGRLTAEPMTPPPMRSGTLLVQALVREDHLVLRWHRLRVGRP